MRHKMVIVAFAVASAAGMNAFTTGCEPEVDAGSSDGTGGNNLNHTGGAGGEQAPGPNAVGALAMRHNPWHSWGTEEEEGSSGGSGDVDPNTLTLFLSNWEHTCTDPWGSNNLSCDRHWLVIELPSTLVAPGAIDLSNSDAVASFIAPFPNYDLHQCSEPRTETMVMTGILEIISVDETQVQFRLQDTIDDFNGEHTAPRCP